MFHVPLKLREPEDCVMPKGPSFSSARTVCSDIDGTEFLFKAPHHQNYRYARERHELDRNITTDNLFFRKYYEEEDAAEGRQDNWREADFFAHSWGFYGPWFTGFVASVHLSIRLVKVVNYPKGVSLFHPRALEQVIGDQLSFLYARYIDKYRGNIQELNAPVNWQPLTQLPIIACKLDAVSQEFLPYDLRRHVYFPITNNIMVSMLFSTQRRFGSKTKAELDKLIDERPMLDLIDNIINSVQVKLSPKAQAQQEAALAGMENTSLAQHYPVLKWDKLNEDEKVKVLAAQKG